MSLSDGIPKACRGISCCKVSQDTPSGFLLGGKSTFHVSFQVWLYRRLKNTLTLFRLQYSTQSYSYIYIFMDFSVGKTPVHTAAATAASFNPGKKKKNIDW